MYLRLVKAAETRRALKDAEDGKCSAILEESAFSTG
jgi:hypothetical protein